jgi:hypothetical protein
MRTPDHRQPHSGKLLTAALLKSLIVTLAVWGVLSKDAAGYLIWRLNLVSA